MAVVRGPVNAGGQQAAAQRAPSQNLQQMLNAAGLLSGGADARTVAKNLLSRLVAQGFGGRNAGKDIGGQLRQALVAMQRAKGLPVTGKLDKATVAMLKNLRVIASDPRLAKGVLGVKDGFERAALPATKDQAQAVKPQTLLQTLQNLLETRFGGNGKALGEWLANVAETVKQGMDGARNTVQNVVARVTGGGAENAAATQAQAQAKSEANPTAIAAHSTVPTETKSKEQARSAAAFAKKKPKSRGRQDGDPLADEGVSEEEGSKGLIGGGDKEGGSPQDGEEDDGTERDADGNERFTGNAPSGDENFAETSRGDATLDEDAEEGPGHYKIPSLSDQIQESFFVIRRDPERPNQPTTYSWDASFYKPDIYGKKQQAEKLLHLEVRSATPFDPVWEKAIKRLSKYLKRHEPKATAPTIEELQAALRRARVHD